MYWLKKTLSSLLIFALFSNYAFADENTSNSVNTTTENAEKITNSSENSAQKNVDLSNNNVNEKIESQDKHIIKSDPSIIEGKLENGLRYYLYPHAYPKGKLNIWLQVKSGSVQEDDDQRGVAHLVEHMLFNGTKDYPGNSMISELEKMGLRFGVDVNAYTSYDETVYHISMPSENPKNIEKVMNMFQNWMGFVTFDPKELDAERGVVIEEWRTRQNVLWRLNEQRRTYTLEQSKYLERSPIGLVETIKNVPLERVKAYYDKWYQPENMSIIITGDFTKEQIEPLIQTEFAALKNHSPIQRENYPIPKINKIRLNTMSDPEYKNSDIGMLYRFPLKHIKTEAEFIEQAHIQILTNLFNQRMMDLIQRGKLNALSLEATWWIFGKDYQGISFDAEAKENDLESAAKALITELKRIDRFGFTDNEIQRQQRRHLTLLKNDEENQASRDSRAIAQRIDQFLLFDVAVLSPAQRHELFKKAYESFNKEVAANLWLNLRKNPDLIIEQVVSSDSKTKGYSWESFLALNQEMKNLPLTAYEININNEPLLAEKIPYHKLTSESVWPRNVHEIQLENGAKAIIVPTEFEDTNVHIIASRRKGLLAYEDDEYNVVPIAVTLANMSGLGKLSSIDLQDWLTDNLVNFTTKLHHDRAELIVSAHKNKLESALQLVYQRFNAAKINPDLLEVFKESKKNEINNVLADPQKRFKQTLTEMRFDDPRALMLTPEKVNSLTPEKLLELDKRLFNEPSDFNFIIVGNINVNDIKPLLQRYLASLKNNLPANPMVVRPLNKEDENKELILNAGQAQYAEVNEYLSHYHYDVSEQERQNMEAFNFFLARDLREEIREKASGVYGIRSVAAFYPSYSSFNYEMTFSCDPDRYQELLELARKVRNNRIQRGITDDELKEYKKLQEENIKMQGSTNAKIASALSFSYVMYDNPILYSRIATLINSLTVDGVNTISKNAFNTKNIQSVGILLPEEHSKTEQQKSEAK